MKNIHSKDTKAEVVLRKALWHDGIRYRKNWNVLPGKPDIVITKDKICVFVDSEFFHGKGYESGYRSGKYDSLKEQLTHSNNSEYWLQKISSNMERDRKVNAELTEEGWTVLRFWSKDVLKNTDECVRKVEETISKKQEK